MCDLLAKGGIFDIRQDRRRRAAVDVLLLDRRQCISRRMADAQDGRTDGGGCFSASSGVLLYADRGGRAVSEPYFFSLAACVIIELAVVRSLPSEEFGRFDCVFE